MATDATNNAGTTTQDSTQTAAPQTTTQEEPVTFSESQQKAIDRIIQDRLARAARASKAELDAANAKAAEIAEKLAAKQGTQSANEADPEAQVAEFRRVSEANRAEADAARKAAEAKSLEAKEAHKKLENYQIQSAIERQAELANFIDPSIVVHLVKDKARLNDDGTVAIIGENNEQRYNNQYKPMSLAEFINEFAESRSYLVRSDVKTGAGSTATAKFNGGKPQYELAQVFGQKSDSKLALKLSRENMPLYKQMRAEAVAQGLLQR